MTWYWWVLIIVGVLAFISLWLIRLLVIIESIEQKYADYFPSYYYEIDLKNIEDAIKSNDNHSILGYKILKLAAGNIDFIEKLDRICTKYEYISEINSKYSEITSEIILLHKSNLKNEDKN